MFGAATTISHYNLTRLEWKSQRTKDGKEEKYNGVLSNHGESPGLPTTDSSYSVTIKSCYCLTHHRLHTLLFVVKHILTDISGKFCF